jgi:hypothetical protein
MVPYRGPAKPFGQAQSIEEEMKKDRQPVENQEPIGIIISNGTREEKATVFSAYIWGPAPEPDPASKAAA